MNLSNLSNNGDDSALNWAPIVASLLEHFFCVAGNQRGCESDEGGARLDLLISAVFNCLHVVR